MTDQPEEHFTEGRFYLALTLSRLHTCICPTEDHLILRDAMNPLDTAATMTVRVPGRLRKVRKNKRITGSRANYIPSYEFNERFCDI